MHEFLLITKYSIMVLVALFAIAGALVLLSLWVNNNTLDMDAKH